MYIVSFRDMALVRCGGVTSAAVYEVDPIGPQYAWAPPQPQTLKLASWDAVQKAFRRKHVLFLIHGFNVDRNHGFTSLGSLAQEFTGKGPLSVLPSPQAVDLLMPSVDLVVPVLWPGDWYLPINYPFVLPDARATGRNFADFILSSATQMARVSFLSHSFGARVVLETVQHTVAANPDYAIPMFDTAILTAAAASDTVLDDPNYHAAVNAMRKIIVVSAATDSVLSGAFPFGNAVEQALWDNDPGPDTALGHSGPRLKASSSARNKTVWYDVGTLQPTVNQQHGDYLPAPDKAVPGYPNGWSDKRERVAELAQAVMQGRPSAWPEKTPIPER